MDTPKITDITKEQPKDISADQVRFAFGRIIRTGATGIVINIDGDIFMMTPEDAMLLASQLYQAGEYMKANPDFEKKLSN